MDVLNKTLRDHNDIDYKTVFEECLFVFDTNTLHDLYRLPSETSNQLQTILADNKVNSRIWMPFQVYLEFSHGRFGIIKKQRSTFEEVIKVFKSKVNELNKFEVDIQNQLESLELPKRHSVMKIEDYKLEPNFEEVIGKLNEFIKDTEALRDNQHDYENDDIIYKKVVELFNNKIGEPFNEDELLKIYDEGDVRYADNIPPGYKDVKTKERDPNKPEDYAYKYGKQDFIKKHGDLVLWKETIKKAKESGSKYVIFICNEKKEDWWHKGKSNQKLKPRYELLNEIYSECPVLEFFHIYEVHEFMNYAKINLDLKYLKAESIKAAKDLSEIPLRFEYSSPSLWRTKERLILGSLYFPSFFEELISEVFYQQENYFTLEIKTDANYQPINLNVENALNEIVKNCLTLFGSEFEKYLNIVIFDLTDEIVFVFNPSENARITESRMMMLEGNLSIINEVNEIVGFSHLHNKLETKSKDFSIGFSKDYFIHQKYPQKIDFTYKLINHRLVRIKRIGRK